ncbi:MAG: hypothetical protein ACLP1Q_21265 [Solirubrobacteraceae bacterium]
MSRLKGKLEAISAVRVAAVPTQNELVSVAHLAHEVASDQALNVELRGSFSLLADELGRAPEKVVAADPRSARLLGEVVALAAQTLPGVA